MSSYRVLRSSCWVPRVSKPQLRASRPLLAPCLCKLGNDTSKRESAAQQPARVQLPVPLSRLLAGCGAAAASLLLLLLPVKAAESFDYTDTFLDASVADSPDILGTLLIVVVTYFTVMLLYLWLSSFLDEQDGGDNGKQQTPPDQAELPPSYGQFLDAHVRSYVGSSSPPGRVRALHDVAQGQPLQGEDLAGLKGRLAAGAAEALDQQIRDCERLVRTKLLSRKLGFGPARTAAAAAHQSSSGSSSSSDGQQQWHQPDVAALLSATVLSSPGGLSSPARRSQIDALIEQHLDSMLPADGGHFQDDLVVRQVMRRLVGQLVVEEALLLLEGVDAGRRALEAAGRSTKPGNKHWAVW